jgi:hypothetical protein
MSTIKRRGLDGRHETAKAKVMSKCDLHNPSRRLDPLKLHWADARPDTTLAHAFIAALMRKEGRS